MDPPRIGVDRFGHRTVWNRLAPTDRRALDLLGREEVARSRQPPREHGWKHGYTSPGEDPRGHGRLCDDTETPGAEAVRERVVPTPRRGPRPWGSASPCQSWGDRWTAITSPRWTADRAYQAGDRVLLHPLSAPSGSLLFNGTPALSFASARPASPGRSMEAPRRRCFRRASLWNPASPARVSPPTPGTPNNSSPSTTATTSPTSVMRRCNRPSDGRPARSHPGCPRRPLDPRTAVNTDLPTRSWHSD
jgi:hypothetical protein